MTTDPVLDDLSEDALTGRSDAAGEPSWLRDRRLEAFKRYLDQDWPDSRLDEFWRSTPFKRIAVDLSLATPDGHVGAAPPALPDRVAGLLTELKATGGSLQLLDEAVAGLELSPALAEQGVVLTDLATAARDHGDIVDAHLGSLTTTNREGTGAGEDRTVTLSDAAWTGGAFLYVPAEVEVTEPLGIHLHVSRAAAHLPRVLVVLERHARATVLIEHTSDDLTAPTTVDEVVEVVVGDEARADVASLQEWSGRVGHLSLQKAAVHRDATYRHLTVTTGGETVRLRPEVDLVGAGSSCEPLGIYYSDEGQHFDLQPFIRHLAPHARSEISYKGALQGNSRTVFRGNVLVGKDAVGTHTNETNRALILTDGARADSTPFLEILCSDVQAGHGSATGQIDREHIFYLESRGIPRREAVRLIVHGFFREILDSFAIPAVRDRAMSHIQREVEQVDLDVVGVSGALDEEGGS